MSIYHCVIIFPFGGLTKGSPPHGLFNQLIALCREAGESKPIVVYDKRSREPKDTKSILSEIEESVDVVPVWGVDTCQDWLAGWGYVLDKRVSLPEESHRVVLLPGDLERVSQRGRLFEQLRKFIRYAKKKILVGDFDSPNSRGAKELIDIYGIYPLVANWFPDAWRAIQALPLRKPRSEFINIAVPELRRLLQSRVFAYEQTLNMLIVNWDWCWKQGRENIHSAERLWEEQMGSMHIGTMEDDSSSRHYRGAVDQIERTERMLRMVWRELNRWDPTENPANFRKLAEIYERLDERSTRIRDAARIALWAQLQQDLPMRSAIGGKRRQRPE